MLSTQTKDGERKGGDDHVHMLNNYYEDGSHGKYLYHIPQIDDEEDSFVSVLIVPKGNPILIPDKSPPSIENCPLYSPPTP